MQTLFSWNHDEIIDLATAFTENGTLKIGFDYLKKVWGRLGETSTSAIEYLVNNPNQALLDANDTLHNFSLPVDPPEGWSKKAHVEISGVEPVMAIRDIRHEHLEKFVAIKGTILRKTEVKFNITTGYCQVFGCR